MHFKCPQGRSYFCWVRVEIKSYRLILSFGRQRKDYYKFPLLSQLHSPLPGQGSACGPNIFPLLFPLLSILCSLYCIPKLLQNLHDKQKLSILIYLMTIRKHLIFHLQSSFDRYLLCLWYFVEGLL